MAMGTFVVVREDTGTDDLTEDGVNGKVRASGETAVSLAKRLASLSIEQRQEISHRALEAVEADLSEGVFVEKFSETIKWVLGRNHVRIPTTGPS